MNLSISHSVEWCMLILTHWGRVTHICVSRLTIIDSDNGLSPGRRQAIIWTNAGILLIGPLRTNFSEILIEILTFSFTKMRLKVSSAKWRPFCLGLNVLTSLWPFGNISGMQLRQEWWIMDVSNLFLLSGKKINMKLKPYLPTRIEQLCQDIFQHF